MKFATIVIATTCLCKWEIYIYKEYVHMSFARPFTSYIIYQLSKISASLWCVIPVELHRDIALQQEIELQH